MNLQELRDRLRAETTERARVALELLTRLDALEVEATRLRTLAHRVVDAYAEQSPPPPSLCCSRCGSHYGAGRPWELDLDADLGAHERRLVTVNPALCFVSKMLVTKKGEKSVTVEKIEGAGFSVGPTQVDRLPIVPQGGSITITVRNNTCHGVRWEAELVGTGFGA